MPPAPTRYEETVMATQFDLSTLNWVRQQDFSDPAHPVPYRHRPIQATYFDGGSKWPSWLSTMRTSVVSPRPSTTKRMVTAPPAKPIAGPACP